MALILRFFHVIRHIFRPIISQWLKIDLYCPKILSPSSSLLLLGKTITHPAARSLCDNWASCFSFWEALQLPWQCVHSKSNCVETFKAAEQPRAGEMKTRLIDSGVIHKRRIDCQLAFIMPTTNDVRSQGFRITHSIHETRCSAIAERPRCRVRYSFRQN